MAEPDAFVRRFERDAVVACAAMAAAALVVPGGGPWMAVAVAGGGALSGASYRAIKGGVDAVAHGTTHSRALVKYFTRYGILAAAAYVMLARLRLHPVGVLTGASSLVVAAAMAAVRSLRFDSRSGTPRS